MNLIKSVLKLQIIFVFASCLTLGISSTAFADVKQNDKKDVIGDALCNITNLMQGKTAKAIAMVATMMLAIGAFTGRLQWTTVIVTMIGIIIIFKAGDFIDMISDTSSISCIQK